MYFEYGNLIFYQIKMFAILLTTAVSIFVWILIVHTFANAMKVLYWETIRKHVKVSYFNITIFLYSNIYRRNILFRGSSSYRRFFSCWKENKFFIY